MTKNGDILFVEFCNILENISGSRSLDDKRNHLRDFLNNFRTRVSNTLYPVLRLILPNEERERGPYRLKEISFTKTILNILGLDNRTQDAKFLRGYKSSDKTANNYSDAAYLILRKHFNLSKNETKLDVNNVNDYLDNIAAKANDVRAQENSIEELFKSTSPLEQKWLIRIILKDLKIGMGRDSILKELHVDGVKVYNNIKDLKKTCELLKDPNKPASGVGISLFNAFQPMLSTRCDDFELRKVVTGKSHVYVENKFDGERFQLHYSNGQFEYFSRQGFKYSNTYGRTYESDGLTKKLKDAFNTSVSSVILDGEMMIWNFQTKSFGSKGMEVDVKKLKNDHKKYAPCFCVFDILYLNGTILTNKPLLERKKLLDDAVLPIEGVIQISQYKECTSINEIIMALNLSMDRNEEGIVFKDVNSIYTPGNRKNWWKMKLEFFKNVMSDLDVVIIGGYYGGGQTKKRVRDYLVGIIDKSSLSPKYFSFAKVTTGLTNEDRAILYKKLHSHWIEVNGNEHENFGIFWGKEKPDVWIKPELSCCFLVRGSELIHTYGTNPAYKANYTLRFPRILSVRLDKPYYDCLTTTELDSITRSSKSVVKLNKRHLEISDIEVLEKKTRKLLIKEIQPVEITSDILENFEFLVLTGKGDWNKNSVELAIRQNGGTVVQAENEKTLCMLVGDVHIRTAGYNGRIDIVNVEWLREILNEGEFSMFSPKHMVYTSPDTKKYFLRLFDKFGDPFLERATTKSIEHICSKMLDAEFERSNYTNLLDSEIQDLNSKMHIDSNIYLGCNVYFDKFKIINDPSSKPLKHNILDEMDFIYKGGAVCDNLTKDCNFVVTNIRNRDRAIEIKSYLEAIKHSGVKIYNSVEEILHKPDVLIPLSPCY